jgi:hypothetical protein
MRAQSDINLKIISRLKDTSAIIINSFFMGLKNKFVIFNFINYEKENFYRNGSSFLCRNYFL